ncbi:MAG: hypothetical protein ACRCUH_12140, partial [Shewanella sp.]
KSKQSELRGQFVQTSQVFINNVTSVDDLEQNMTMLAEMLSFATNSQVGFIGWKLIGGEGCEGNLGRIRSIGGCYSAFKPPLCVTRPTQVVRFIENCWQKYSELHLPRKLNVVIDLFTIPDAKELPLELQLATTFILLENLKASYATENYAFKDGWYRDQEGLRLTFNHLVKEMFQKVGMIESTTWSNLRNDIIHSGLCNLSPEDIRTQYSRCRDEITEYLLRLLGYQGEFFLNSGRGDTTKIITPQAPEPVGASE